MDEHVVGPDDRKNAGTARATRGIAAIFAVALIAGACSGSDFAWMDDTPLSVLRESLDSGGKQRSSTAKSSNRRRKGSRAALVPAPRTKPAPPHGGQEAALPPGAKGKHGAVTPEGHVVPSKLVGLDEREVMQLLGQPEHVRAKPPATIWSYRKKNCTLEVFFYLDLSTERFRVLAYEVDSVRGTTEMKKVCLGRIQSAFRTN